MTKSMTAFSRADGPRFAWEVRAVNQRHLDANFRMPDDFRVLEPALRARLRDYVSRGKLECSLRIQNVGGAESSKTIDEQALQHLSRLIDHVSATGHAKGLVSPLEMLRWPGVLQEEAEDFDALSQEIQSVFDEALGQLVAMREREGQELERLTLSRLDALAEIVNKVRDDVPNINERLIAKLRDRINELDVDADPARLETEIAIMAQKADVQEELDRLDTHVTEVKNAFSENGPIGRRLDFLMQELNREANTLSSKTSAGEMSLDAVELKVLMEQMREQIQNIE